MRITDQIFAYPWQGRGNNCNSYIIKGKKTILIDPGHIYTETRESGLEMLARQAAVDGFKLDQIDLILCTHGHPDHIEGAGILREQSGALMAMHQQDEFILDVLEQRYAAATGKEMPTLKPDFYLQEGALELGEGETEQIEVIHTPGHSPGSVSFFLQAQQALFTGDTVFQNSIGRADLPGGDMNVLEKSLAKLAQLEGVELLLPGHMGHISGAENVERNFTRIRKAFFR